MQKWFGLVVVVVVAVRAFDAQAFFAAGDELALRPAMARWGRT